MTRDQRRVLALGGLLLDIAAALALAAAVLAGAYPARSAAAPAVTIAVFIAFETAYLYFTRPRSRP